MNVEPIKSDDRQVKATQEVTGKVVDNTTVAPIGKMNIGRSDKLDLSAESKNLNAIEAKVISGAYNKPEIFRAVATKLNQELPPEEMAKN